MPRLAAVFENGSWHLHSSAVLVQKVGIRDFLKTSVLGRSGLTSRKSDAISHLCFAGSDEVRFTAFSGGSS